MPNKVREKQNSSSEWSKIAIIGFVFSFLGPLAIVGLGISIKGLFSTKHNIKRGKGLAIAGIIVGAIMFLGFINSLTFEHKESYSAQTNFLEDDIQKTVQSTDVFKASKILSSEEKDYNFTQIETSRLKQDPEGSKLITDLCGSIEAYPANISVYTRKGIGIIILGSSSGDILCDHVFPEAKDEIITMNLNKFPKVIEHEKYEITLVKISKTSTSSETLLKVDYQILNKETGETSRLSSPELFTECDFIHPYFVDLETNSFFPIMDYISKCSRSIKYETKKAKTGIYLKDIDRPIKLVFITDHRLISSEDVWRDIREGTGENLYVFDVNVHDLEASGLG